jgi:cAMP-dependent protein kinase regulator
MSLPHDYASILNDLNRDVIRFRPLDALQFCANWFARRLEDERKAALAQSAAAAAESDSAPAAAPSPFAAASPFASGSSSSAAASGTPFGNANPFGSAPGAAPAFSFDPPSRSASIASSAGAPAAAHDGDDDDALHPGLAPSPGYNLGRRTSVSAESLAPSAPSDGVAAPKLVIPKSDSQMARIRASIASNVLFRNLDAEQEADVLNAMKEVHVAPGEAVIRQGDQGDYFYVVESGSFDIYVRSTSAPSTSSAGTSDDDARVAGGDAASLGDKKAVAGPSSSFGELALLYAQPRAASVLATQASVLWALDRITFRSILIGTNSRKRSLFEAHLRNVSLFDSLSDAERAKIADALEQRAVEQGARVIEQGERGSEFFIVIDGSAEVRKRREADGVEESVGRLGAGDYFGGECKCYGARLSVR